MMSATKKETVVRGNEGQEVKFTDVDMTYKVGPDATPSRVAVHEWELGARRLAGPPHRHENEDEIFYVLAGEVTVMQDEEVTTVGAGNYVILPRGHFHTFWNASDSPARLLVILAAGDLEDYFIEAGELLGAGGPPDLEQVGQIIARYGLTLQFERVPELMMEYGLEGDLPLPPGGSPGNDDGKRVATS